MAVFKIKTIKGLQILAYTNENCLQIPSHPSQNGNNYRPGCGNRGAIAHGFWECKLVWSPCENQYGGKVFKKLKNKLGMVAQTRNSSTWKTEAGESLLVQGHPGLHSESKGRNKALKIEIPYNPLLGMYQKDS